MGLAQARQSDMVQSHPGYSPIPQSTGSQNVIINGLGQLNTDFVQTPHPPIPPVPPEAPFTFQVGSQTVNINGAPQVRVMDSTSCGGFVLQGSQNVLIG